MNLTELLAILKEVNAIIAALRDMGLKVNGSIDLATILSLLPKP